MTEPPGPSRAVRTLALGWGLGGVVLLLVSAVVRLSPRALDALDMALAPGHWVFAGLWTAFMLYTEGYRGFQRRFSPTCAARARHLAVEPHPVRLALAPLFCMGYFHGTRRRVLTSWVLTGAIVCLVLIVHQVAQPWRGLIDLGVVAGLSYGIVSLLVIARRGAPGADPQLPHRRPEARVDT